MTAVTELRSGPGLWRAPSWLLLAWGVRGAVGSKDGGQLREGQGLSASGLAFCSVGPGRNAGRLGKRPLYLRPGSCARTPGALPRRGLRARAPWPGTDGAAHARPRAAASLRPPVSEHVCARPPHGSTGVPGHEGPSDGKVGLARWPHGRQAVGCGGLQCRGPGGQRWCGTAAESGGLFLGRGPSRTDAAPSLPAAAPWPRLRFAASLSRSPVGLGASRLPGQKRSRGGTEAFCWPGPHETVTAGWRRASSVDVLASGTPLRPAPSGGSVS